MERARPFKFDRTAPAVRSRRTLGHGPGNAHTTVLKQQRLSEFLRGRSVAHHGLLARPSWPHPQPHRPGSAAQQDHPADLKLSRLTSHLGCARPSAAPLGFARPSAARKLDYLVPASSLRSLALGLLCGQIALRHCRWRSACSALRPGHAVALWFSSLRSLALGLLCSAIALSLSGIVATSLALGLLLSGVIPFPDHSPRGGNGNDSFACQNGNRGMSAGGS